MKNEKEYILFHEIQNYIREHNEQTNTTVAFHEAFYSLREKGEVHMGAPEFPDFMRWDFANDGTFLELINNIPVTADLIGMPVLREQEDTYVIFAPLLTKMMVSKEMCGTPYECFTSNCYTIIYVLKGRLNLYLKTQEQVMQTGELCIIYPGVRHAKRTREEDIVLNIIVDKDSFEESFFSMLKQNDPLSYFFRQIFIESGKEYLFFMLPPSDEIRQIYQHLFQEFLKQDSLSYDISINYVKILFSHIIRSGEDTYHYYTAYKKDVEDVYILYLVKYIEENHAALSLTELAEKFNYERCYLSKMIRKSTGKTFTEIITMHKLTRAVYYLEQTNLKMDEIASKVGYNSLDHFSRSFKKYYQISPREYRKRKT